MIFRKPNKSEKQISLNTLILQQKRKQQTLRALKVMRQALEKTINELQVGTYAEKGLPKDKLKEKEHVKIASR